MMAYPCEYIEWTDHTAEQMGWQDIDGSAGSLAFIKSIGWVIGETNDALVLAVSRDDTQANGIMTIAKGLITKRRKVRI